MTATSPRVDYNLRNVPMVGQFRPRLLKEVPQVTVDPGLVKLLLGEVPLADLNAQEGISMVDSLVQLLQDSSSC